MNILIQDLPCCRTQNTFTPHTHRFWFLIQSFNKIYPKLFSYRSSTWMSSSSFLLLAFDDLTTMKLNVVHKGGRGFWEKEKDKKFLFNIAFTTLYFRQSHLCRLFLIGTRLRLAHCQSTHTFPAAQWWRRMCRPLPRQHPMHPLHFLRILNEQWTWLVWSQEHHHREPVTDSDISQGAIQCNWKFVWLDVWSLGSNSHHCHRHSNQNEPQ